MKIDLIITELETGGAEKCCFELAKFLRRRSHDARIISIGPLAIPPKDAILNQAIEAKVPVLSLEAANIYQLPKAWLNLRRHLRRDPPEIVQSFMWHANVLAAGTYPGYGIPLVGGARVLDRNPSRIRSSAWASKRMKYQVAVSREVAEWSHQSEKYSRHKIVTIPNGIDLQKWDAKHAIPTDTGDLYHRLPIDTPVLLVVGRMNEQKGTDKLASLLPNLLGELPNHHIVFLGDGPYRSLIEEKKNDPTIGSRVHTLGVCKFVKAWMKRSQVLLLSSLYEGMPNVILEAMASELAVATTQVEGIADLLDTPELAAQATPLHDWDSWQSNVIQLANNSQLRESLGIKNRSQIEAKFQLDNILTQYEALYLRVLEEIKES